MSKPPQDVVAGAELPARTITVDRQQLVEYAGASGDQNPIHQDEDFARKVGLPDVIAHGMWTMGAAIEVVSDWVGDPGRVVSYSTRFTNPVVVPAEGGAQIEVGGTVKSVDEGTHRATVELTVTSGGNKVLGRATAVVDLG
ncbi:MaoC family dehydratase [Ornithinicoccus hortensis]|uniref:Acyl dehydratase n=1 Tax=Ornithinicoccus hortensis TaxID=82346 RepID=A0A542YPF3_9MICO|nr:MaoC family dehydratase [Ornithinicoccus hortensis]TQL49982.1 acyl dehydratase [Ornithinicoccus hortensis]